MDRGRQFEKYKSHKRPFEFEVCQTEAKADFGVRWRFTFTKNSSGRTALALGGVAGALGGRVVALGGLDVTPFFPKACQ